jgi:hypothetical protein
MSRYIISLLIALSIHLLFVIAYFFLIKNQNTDNKTINKPQEKRLKVSLKELPKKYKNSGNTKKKKITTQPTQKRKQPKKIIKKPLIKHNPKPIKKVQKSKPKVIKPKPQPKKTKPIKPPMKNYIPLLPPKEEKPPHKPITKPVPIKKDPLAWMYEDKSSTQQKTTKTKKINKNNINQNIKALYGDKFNQLSHGQQKYIIDNQEIMRMITQEVLNRVASVNLKNPLRVNRNNIIEFYLHPNGDMTDFKFLHNSGYYILDETTKETIEYAYSRYPRPKEKTLIRYNVIYNLAY